MKILFVSSGNCINGISPVIKNQGESIKNQGIDVDYYTIKGKGFLGYLKNILPLKKKIKENQYELIHAHYSLTAFAVLLSFPKVPIVVSFMGDDLLGSQRKDGSYTIRGKIEKKFSKIVSLFAACRIVKSKEMADKLNKSIVIPNGVDFDRFKPIVKEKSLNKINLSDYNREYILFPANPDRDEKNYNLFNKALKELNNNLISELKFIDVSNDITPFYYNASSVVVLTSYHEGSPNVIKEAMACNIPIVSTDVGDVREVIGKTKGCYITTFEPKDVADKIQKALVFNKRTTGREDIKHLESGVVAKKIIEVYKKVLDKKYN